MVHIPEYEPHSFNAYFSMVIWILKYNLKGAEIMHEGVAKKTSFWISMMV